MKIYIASDHGGFELKKHLLGFVRELGYEIEDCGAFQNNPDDDYPPIISSAARKLSLDVEAGIDSRAIVVGASGQGEAIVANRFKGVRAVVYYGPAPRSQTDVSGKELNMIASTREHNDANVLSLGARFISEQEAKDAVKLWLETPFSGEERHARRINKIDKK
ncbi:MAG: RpiB/LacA/LacB family sugar-phosphate isomerase [Patescibacteria group bacterium]